MKILFETHSDNPDYSADCDYAVVEATTALLEQIYRRVELARQALQQDEDLTDLHFWGSTAEFYSSRLLESCQEAIAAATTGTEEVKTRAATAWLDAMEGDGHILLPDGVDPGAPEIQRTECNRMIIRCHPLLTGGGFEIAWTAIPRHTDIYVTTSYLPLSALEVYAYGNEREPGGVPMAVHA